MCTVTYIPKGNDHFLLTSNRDENYQRATGTPVTQLSQSRQSLFPKDPKSGGTWIAVSENNKIACILNGAFIKHSHRPPYVRSRGLVLLDFFNHNSIAEFISTYDFVNIEPFTLILYEPNRLMEFRWDGQRKYQLPLDLKQKYIWSSCTLYDEEVSQRRALWFDKWLESNSRPDVEEILDFHRYGGEKDAINGLVMNRENKVQTLSITSIEKKGRSANMYHLDLLKDSVTSQRIDLKNETVETN